MRTLAIVIVLATTGEALARAPADAPALPAPVGKVIKVANVEELYKAVSGVASDTTILLQKGTYQLHKPVFVAGKKKNIAIRGATGRFDDVVLKGAGMGKKEVQFGIMADETDGLLIADLTIGWVGNHPIMLQARGKNVQVYHCRLVDAGEQFVKASSDGKGGGHNNGKVEYCLIEYAKMGPANGYTNGVDVHGGKNWIIRHNLFRNIRTPEGAQNRAVPSVLMWNGAKNTICEGNTFINCDRAIAFGLIERQGFLDHQGGVIRNNFIYVGPGEVKHVDAGIFVVSPGTKVLHNTILQGKTYPNAIETRFAATKNVEVHNNLTEGAIVARDGAIMAAMGNVSSATESMFRNPKAGDLHLTAKTGLKPVKPQADCPETWDGTKRPKPQTVVGGDDPEAKRE